MKYKYVTIKFKIAYLDNQQELCDKIRLFMDAISRFVDIAFNVKLVNFSYLDNDEKECHF